MKKTMQKQLIVFDLDGTLIDSPRILLERNFRIARELGLPVTEELLQRGRTIFGVVVNEFAQTLWPGTDSDRFARRFFELDAQEELPVFDGVSKALETLTAQGRALAVHTSRPHAATHGHLHRAGVFSLMSFVCTKEEGRPAKPDPQSILPFLDQFFENGATISEMLYVGDVTTDGELARRLNMDFVAVTSGLTSREAFLGSGTSAEHIISSVADLPRWLEEHAL